MIETPSSNEPISTLNILSDGSCLFNAISLGIKGEQKGDDLRILVAYTILGDPVTYNKRFLEIGMEPNKYAEWIGDCKKKNWGGKAELKILSKHYGTQINVIHVLELKIEEFGDKSFEKEIYLIYDGTHYDLAY